MDLLLLTYGLGHMGHMELLSYREGNLLLLSFREGGLLLMYNREGDLLLLYHRRGWRRKLPGLHVHVGPSDISWVLLASLSLRGDQTILLPGLGLVVLGMRLPGLGAQMLLPRLGVRMILLSGLRIV